MQQTQRCRRWFIRLVALAYAVLLLVVAPCPQGQEQADQPGSSRLLVRAQQEYAIGLPVPVQLTYEKAGYLVSMPDHWVGRSLMHASFLADWRVLDTGRYALEVRLPWLPPQNSSAAVEVQMRALTEDEQRALEALFVHRRPPRLPWHWTSFLGSNPHTIPGGAAQAFQPDVRPIADFYVWLHRALWGPTEPEGLDAAELDALATGVFKAEAAALKYELLVARDDPGAAELRTSTLDTWPGLKWRLDRADQGEGFLAAYRAGTAREAPWKGVTGPSPYSEEQ